MEEKESKERDGRKMWEQIKREVDEEKGREEEVTQKRVKKRGEDEGECEWCDGLRKSGFEEVKEQEEFRKEGREEKEEIERGAGRKSRDGLGEISRRRVCRKSFSQEFWQRLRFTMVARIPFLLSPCGWELHVITTCWTLLPTARCDFLDRTGWECGW